MSVLKIDPPFYDGGGDPEYYVVEEVVDSEDFTVVFDGMVTDISGFLADRGYRKLTVEDRRNFNKHCRLVIIKGLPETTSRQLRARRRRFRVDVR